LLATTASRLINAWIEPLGLSSVSYPTGGHCTHQAQAGPADKNATKRNSKRSSIP
jgi:hypothetical protein